MARLRSLRTSAHLLALSSWMLMVAPATGFIAPAALSSPALSNAVSLRPEQRRATPQGFALGRRRQGGMATLLSQASNNNGDDAPGGDEQDDYTVAARLREEAESPFRSVRLFLYGGFMASGAIGAVTSFTAALAAYSGVPGSAPIGPTLQNLGIDVAAIAISATLWNLDQKGRSRRLDRMTVGAKIAALRVQLQDGDRGIVSLSDFRRNRGLEKRVVIVAGNKQVVQAALDAAAPLSDQLCRSAFVVIPVVLNGSPGDQDLLDKALNLPHVAWPMTLGEWREYLGIETAAAKKQGIDAEQQGIAIVLKLNGRVGQRSFGRPNWNALVGDVEARRSRGMDVTNI